MERGPRQPSDFEPRNEQKTPASASENVERVFKFTPAMERQVDEMFEALAKNAKPGMSLANIDDEVAAGSGLE